MNKPTGDPHKHVIEQGISELSRLRAFAKDHDHSVVALKSDDWSNSFFLMRNERLKNGLVLMLKTGDTIVMNENWDAGKKNYYWLAVIV